MRGEGKLNFLIWLLAIIIAVDLTAIAYFYFEYKSVPKEFSPKVKLETKEPTYHQTRQLPKPSIPSKGDEEALKAQQGDLPDALNERAEELEKVVSNYFVYLRSGIERKPALVLKVIPQGGETLLYLLTYYPMEWQFVKVELGGYKINPQRVFLCEEGLVVLEAKVKGLLPPEVSRGELGDYGLLVSFESFRLKGELFKGACKRNGFVFNLAGDFSGVCFGGTFISSSKLYSEVPDNCKIIYQKEGKDGNLQS